MVQKAMKDFSKLEKEELIALVQESRGAIEKKRLQLHMTRKKLSSARKRMQKMKDIILYQRQRILER